MNGEEEENIDRTQWVDWSDKDPLIKPERKDIIAMSGDRGGTEYRILATNTVLSYMTEKHYFTAEQFSSAVDYQHWRDYFAAQWEGRPQQPYWQTLANITSDGITGFLYMLLLQRLHRLDQKTIDFCIDTPSSDHLRWLADTRFRWQYPKIFDRLTAVMDKLKTCHRAAKKDYNGAPPERIANVTMSLFLNREIDKPLA